MKKNGFREDENGDYEYWGDEDDNFCIRDRAMKPIAKARRIANTIGRDICGDGRYFSYDFDAVVSAAMKMHEWDVEQFEKYLVQLLNQKNIQDCELQRVLVCDILAELIVKWKK